MTQVWEYTADFITYDRSSMSGIISELAAFGEDGWELVTWHDGLAIFKRPLQAQIDTSVKSGDVHNTPAELGQEQVKKQAEEERRRHGMDPKKFAELGQKVLAAIPPTTSIQLSAIVEMVGTDDSGYTRSDAKSALLDLKATGKVQLDENGTVRRK